MSTKLEILKQAWDRREGPIVFTTVDRHGVPNAVYALSIKLLSDGGVAVADNKFHKTRENIKNGSLGSILFLTKDRTSFQAKGRIEYHASGPIFEEMLTWVDPKFARIAVAVLRVERLYSGAEEL